MNNSKWHIRVNIVNRDGVATDTEKASAVADRPVQKNLKELEALVGTAGYHWQYFKCIAK